MWEEPVETFSIVDTRRLYEWVFGIYVPIGLGVFVLFTVTIIALVVRYRVRPPDRPARRHEANALETTYAVVLTAVAAFLLYITFTAEHKEDTVSAQTRPAVTINVTAARWEWVFAYPAYGIRRQSGQVGRQSLVVPVGVPVRLRLSSVDVIHSLWIPQLYFKRDAIPGAVETVTLDFDRVGTFGGSCAEFCGVGHSEMVFTVEALTPRRFRAWAASHGQLPA